MDRRMVVLAPPSFRLTVELKPLTQSKDCVHLPAENTQLEGLEGIMETFLIEMLWNRKLVEMMSVFQPDKIH